MSRLGIYFGLEGIKIVEIRKRKIVSRIDIPRSSFEITEELAEEKVPQEIKIVALIKEELRKAKIQPKEVSLVIPGREIILRNFDIPLIPQNELFGAVSFEAKKYIPFKIEDLVWDYKANLDKTNKRYNVLFLGIRKDVLERYLHILRELEVKILGIEYTGFSILRILKAERNLSRGVIGLVSIDKQDETNFCVLKDGFPIFSRDIVLTEVFETEEDYLEKLKSEIRISWDFYQRKYPALNLNRLFLLVPLKYQPEIEGLLSERKVPIITLKPKSLKGIWDISTPLLKAYAAAIREIKIDLPEFLIAKEKLERLLKKEKIEKQTIITKKIPEIFSGFKLSVFTGIVSLIIIGLGFFLSFPEIRSLQKELNGLINSYPPGSLAGLEASYKSLIEKEAGYKRRLVDIQKKIKERIFLTRILDLIAKNKPEGAWLGELYFRRDSLKLRGWVYLGNSNEEIERINNFLTSLKKESYFNQYFLTIEIESLEKTYYKDKPVTAFVIGFKGRRQE